ncbi:MAG: hypothetical protein AVDCRST_MAG93-2656, partial [uncultured Chloroflexia bacterium]
WARKRIGRSGWRRRSVTIYGGGRPREQPAQRSQP